MKKENYEEFLKKKVIKKSDAGFDIEKNQINDICFDFQKDIIDLAVKKGNFAIFAECGLGKTILQLEWAKFVTKKENKPIIILAPLAVSEQTINEAKEKLGLYVVNIKTGNISKDNIYITNYEQIENIDFSLYCGVVTDESSILKSYMGKIKRMLIDQTKHIKYKLACTATPSPNDIMEILNHAEYLNIMKSNEALAIWFILDSMNSGKYRLKHYAESDFWKWVSSWSVYVENPVDLGYRDKGYSLPKKNTIHHIVDVDIFNDDEKSNEIFRKVDLNATSYNREKRRSLSGRVKKTAEIVNNSDEQFIVWCELNAEADELKKSIDNCIEVRGPDKQEKKLKAIRDFKNNDIKVIIAKPKMFGYGLNLQNCFNMVFCGLSYSFENYYQAVRRIWRFGQLNPVNIHIVYGSTEYDITKTVNKKQKQHEQLKKGMQEAMKDFMLNTLKKEYHLDYEQNIHEGENFTMINGDSVEEIKKIRDESIDFSIFSPPFSQLYIYSDSYRDMGNNKGDDNFYKHFEFMIPDLLRVTVPGRLCAVHVKQLVNYKGSSGQSGLRDFRGDVIKLFQKHGWIYHSEVAIWKDPVIEMQRTKSQGLLWKQLRKDASYSRVGLPEYLVIFRKWTDDYEDRKPITNTKESFPVREWQKIASPIWETQPDEITDKERFSYELWERDLQTQAWFDIRQTNVLNIKIARADKDEKHICPLQLDVIEKAVKLWTNEGDTVFTPFGGIGSELYQSILMKRKAIGIELKKEYYEQAIKNCESAEEKLNEPSLFDQFE